LERWQKKWKKIYNEKFVNDALQVLPIKEFERKKKLAMHLMAKKGIQLQQTKKPLQFFAGGVSKNDNVLYSMSSSSMNYSDSSLGKAVKRSSML
jgi:hypothetical protein